MLSLMPALFSGLFAAADAETRLDAERWQTRPILVFAEADDPRLADQLSRLEADRAALAERQNVVIVDTLAHSLLRTRFRPEGFTVILVGLDGGEKFRETEVVDPDRLNALIDAMPMRRNELRRQGSAE
ncbi:MAG: DUF4174 domain-containing protein [Paracoccaceae bacterium]